MKTVRALFLLLAVLASLFVPARLEWEEQERGRQWAAALSEEDRIVTPDEWINENCGLSLRIDSTKWGEERIFSSMEMVFRIQSTLENRTGKTLLLAGGSGILEWSPDRRQWYNLFRQNCNTLRMNKSIQLHMAYLIEFTPQDKWGKRAPYLPEGRSQLSSTFCHASERERAENFPLLPDGYYRLVLRVCEYAAPQDVFHMRAQLEDYAWIRSAPFRVRNGQLA